MWRLENGDLKIENLKRLHFRQIKPEFSYLLMLRVGESQRPQPVYLFIFIKSNLFGSKTAFSLQIYVSSLDFSCYIATVSKKFILKLALIYQIVQQVT